MPGPDFSKTKIGETLVNCSADKTDEKENKPCIPAKCFVNFRPKADWKGEYGFDWMREADFVIKPGAAGLFGDLKFEDVAGKYYVIEKPGCLGKLFGAGNKLKVQPDGNSFDGTFSKEPTLYSNLKTEYEGADIDFTAEGGGTVKQNFISYLSVFTKESAAGPTIEIQAQTIIKEPPEELKLKYNTALFKITPEKLSNLGVNFGGTPHKETISIECKSTFASDETIEVISVFKKDTEGAKEEVVVGKLKVIANDKPHRKIKKIALIAVKTPEVVSGAGEQTGNTANQSDMFTKFLNQALVDPDVETETLDITAEADFTAKYISSNNIICYKLNDSGFEDIHTYLYKKLQQMLKAADAATENKYDNYFKAFYLGQDAGYITATGAYQGLNGYSQGKFVIVTPTSNEGTAAHELLHSLGLPHTFDGISANAKFTYEAKKTENIMDYSHQLGVAYNNARVSLWHWQWSIANSNAENEP